MLGILEINRRPLWGDYGDILLQGQYVKSENTYRGFAPRSNLTYSRGTLIVDQAAMDVLSSACPNCHFNPCSDVELYEYDWRPHASNLEPPFYPDGGEPVSYFDSGLDIAESIPLWAVEICEFVHIAPPTQEQMLQSIRDTLCVPRPELSDKLTVPDVALFAARYAPTGNNVAYYIKEDVAKTCHLLFDDAVFLAET